MEVNVDAWRWSALKENATAKRAMEVLHFVFGSALLESDLKTGDTASLRRRQPCLQQVKNIVGECVGLQRCGSLGRYLS
jgi:hypothetical protein